MAILDVTDKTSLDRAGSQEDKRPTGNKFFSLSTYSPAVRIVGASGLVLYLFFLWVATRWAPDYWTVSVLWSSAFMALGWAVGFLFGVPRVATTGASTRVNTNLEQISDWLTKIIIGVGLTQIQQLPRALRALAGYVSKDFGKSGNDVFSLSMVLYFGTLGFLTGYLLTRLALQREFEEAAAEKAAKHEAAAEKAAKHEAVAEKATADEAARVK